MQNGAKKERFPLKLITVIWILSKDFQRIVKRILF